MRFYKSHAKVSLNVMIINELILMLTLTLQSQRDWWVLVRGISTKSFDNSRKVITFVRI